MIIPVLKDIVVRGEPECADDFILSANADIGVGAKDEEGVEYFYFRIISSKRLLSMLKEDSIIDCRATFMSKEN
ncbi:hypothetical protein [Brevibacillus brevis]|uniref:hypothetical protein n=1 Tax=Brevibacillus brevis TaxID=1393 RepID=UPI0025A5DC26|nr:hypothetical protein [Brevibacillus brevis]WJQ83380.1 hypothetical protein QN310_09675 [Brevibacillus brevis]